MRKIKTLLNRLFPTDQELARRYLDSSSCIAEVESRMKEIERGLAPFQQAGNFRARGFV